MAMDTVVVVKTEVVQPVAEQQVVTEVQVTAPVDGEAKVNATAANPYRPSKVTRFAELTTTEGVGLVFIDAIAEGQVDTVRLIIPEPPVALQPAADAKDTVVVLSPLERPYGDSVKKADAGEPVVEERKVEPVKVVPVDTRSVRTNNCPAVADEADFLKLRKKMAATRTDDAMLEEARRYFKDRCFTVGQIRNLSALFLTDEGKYRFFDVSYPYASNLGSFSGLQEELRDPYYINRFRAMLR